MDAQSPVDAGPPIDAGPMDAGSPPDGGIDAGPPIDAGLDAGPPPCGTSTDPLNCGSCGHACVPGVTCTGGVCGGPTPTTWTTDATAYCGLAGVQGTHATYVCPAGGNASIFYGIDGIYAAESQVCDAAVHAGRITATNGGTVEIEIRAGQNEYENGLAHGLYSNYHGPSACSFAIVSSGCAVAAETNCGDFCAATCPP